MRKGAFILFCLILLSGCAASPRFTGGERTVYSPDIRRWEASTPLLTVEGIASYYAHEFHGRKTANGEIYDMYELTAAHKSFPFDTIIRVNNVETGKSVVVRVNDRGPFVEGRIIDLSYAAAQKIGMIDSGISTVRLEILQWGIAGN